MNAEAMIPKEQLMQILEESPFEHLTSSVHVMDRQSGRIADMAGDSQGAAVLRGLITGDRRRRRRAHPLSVTPPVTPRAAAR